MLSVVSCVRLPTLTVSAIYGLGTPQLMENRHPLDEAAVSDHIAQV